MEAIRAFAKVTDVKAGDILHCDARFDCGIENKNVEVNENIEGLFVHCNCGKHYLAGNIDFENDPQHYIGYYFATDAEKKNVSTITKDAINIKRKKQ